MSKSWIFWIFITLCNSILYLFFFNSDDRFSSISPLLSVSPDDPGAASVRRLSKGRARGGSESYPSLILSRPRGHYELLRAREMVSCTRRILKRRRTLSVTGRPDMVHNCTTSNTSTNSFSVRCTEGFNGGLPQSFLLEVRESNSQELRVNLTSPVPRFNVTHLDSGALYQACIYAYNDKGRSEAMVVQAGTLRLPEKQLTSESGRKNSPVPLPDPRRSRYFHANFLARIFNVKHARG